MNSSVGCANVTTNSSCMQPPPGNPASILYTFGFGSGIYMLIMAVLTIPANSALLLVIFVDPFKTFRNSPSTYFLVGVGVSDLLTSLFQEPMYATVFIMTYLKDPRMTIEIGGQILDIARTIANVALTAALLIILALTITQYIVIVSPLKYARSITKKKVILTVLLIYLYSIFFWVVLNWAALRSFESRLQLDRLDAFLHCLLVPVINIIFLTALHVAFKRKMKEGASLRSESSRQGNHEREQQIQVRRKLITFNFMLMAVIFFCSQPIAILWWLRTFLWTDVREINKRAIAVGIASFMTDNVLYLKCLLDPIVYAWRLPKYRQALKKVLHCSSFGLKRRSKYQGRVQATISKSTETVVTLDMTKVTE